ncbi:PREDICTED: uncharacterized protein LOC109180003 [Ipomoea nil]|uniref:uncharacterized protein LOC109180003 n=1 Tax=Ipomoea nil TaxID=35883 RepID=UPI0009012A62|nr:PREDICTED: uncharacterized protein LOC109180003 [Ipomoea nil]
MASLHCFGARASSPYSSSILPILHLATAGGGSRPESPFIFRLTPRRNAQSTHFNFRLRSSDWLHLKQKPFQVFASNPNPSKGSYATEGNNVPQGPPLATILAGFLVLFAVCWILGSIVMWLVSLITNVPSSK